MTKTEKRYHLTKTEFHRYGVFRKGETLYVTCELHAMQECGILLWNDKLDELRISFPQELKIGAVYCAAIEQIPVEYCYYVFYEDQKRVQDPYARCFAGTAEWGIPHPGRCACVVDEVAFTKIAVKTAPAFPPISYENSLIYLMHVRGFTMHSTSKTKHPGTFDALREKIPYLQELGVTTLELMPVYEFEECEEIRSTRTDYFQERYMDMKDIGEKEPAQNKVNYWGFVQGYMMAPKASYAYQNGKGADACEEFASLIEELHRNHMEIILQVYFPEGTRQGYMLEVLRFWVMQYHVDGFHLKGIDLPLEMITSEPLFANTKLFYYGFDTGRIRRYYDTAEDVMKNHLAVHGDSFMILARRFIKGDSDTALGILDEIKRVPEDTGRINYVTSYDTLTLQDTVMYDKKHNEDNGEAGKDGTDYNYSWNCGVEGPSKKAAVMKLREKQKKNLLTILMLSQGTPCVTAGDEMMHTAKGNNNPYCQDNETSWLKWSQSKAGRDWMEFCKKLITFRMSHNAFRRTRPFEMLDARGCGYPDLSIHSDEAWKSKLNNYDHAFALLYSGVYSREEEDIYVAYNMYWEEQDFALPKLAEQKKWYLIMDTDRPVSFLTEAEEMTAPKVYCAPRSIRILIGK